MSVFNPQTFLQTQQEGGLETKYTPIPEGEYRALIDEVTADLTKNGAARMTVTYSILDDDLKTKLNVRQLTVRQTIFLDLDEHGSLKRGTNANVKLGKLLEACDMNLGKWSPGALKGKGPMMIAVSQRADESDPEIKYNDVKRVGKIR